MIGTTLGHFEITGKLGEGGMGEVYRARDTKLGREVALKVLPAAFTQDPQRMGRFAREAQVLAALNHGNIAAIHGLVEDGDRRALVLELIEGETLAERIARGPLSVEESARIGLEMARAIEFAHDKGIVHRDLKPANVKLTPDGTVKVLDFGLAKALEEETAAGNVVNSPTLTAAATQAGMILGTAAYMAPEQAVGALADRRSDVWSYGVVLAEMLTGRRQFSGDTVPHTLASVLKDEPSWEHFPPHVPPRVVDLLRRCLRKEPKQRLQAIGEARVLWEEYLADPRAFAATAATGTPGAAPPSLWRRRLPWAVAAALAVALGVVGLQWSSLAQRPQPLVRATILPPDGHDWYLDGNRPGRVAISPDGRQLAFVALGEGDAAPLLWVRPLDSPVARPLPGTEAAGYPFWSPDGRHVAFFAGGKLKKIAVAGGPPVVLCDASNGKSGSWNRRGDIVFTPTHVAPIYRVAAAGGEPVALTELDNEAGEVSHRHPVFLPDDRHFLYVARRGGANKENMLRVGSLDGTTDRDLIAAPTNAAYASGRLLFMRGDTLMTQPFDPGSLELSGEAVPLVERVLQIPGAALSGFAVSETGTLIYHTGEVTKSSRLVWKDRRGVELGTLGEPADQRRAVLSPDGRRAVAPLVGEEGQADLWIYDVDRGLRSRFTFDAADELVAVWSPDGRRIAFASDRDDGVYSPYLKDLDGTGEAELLLASERMQFPVDWTPDGKMVVGIEVSSQTGMDLIAIPIDGDRKPIPLLVTEFNERSPQVSPDGRWLAYRSDESGRDEVYVTTFPAPSRKWQVSLEAGMYPRWTRNGREIVYLQGDSLIAVAVSAAGDTFEIGAATKLFDVDVRDSGHWDVTADGERFLINPAPERGRGASVLHLAVNWPAMLEEQ